MLSAALRHTSLSATASCSPSACLTQPASPERRGGRREEMREAGREEREVAGSNSEMMEARWTDEWRDTEVREREGSEKIWRDNTG